MTNAQPVFRFAPSPNGPLHLGHALSAVLNFRAASALRGRFLVRIEDIDPVRSRGENVLRIFDDLTWLGLTWEEPVRRQSAHLGAYEGALERLRARGLVYPCFCSRADISRAVASPAGGPRDPDGAPLYPGTCRGIGAGDVAARLATGQRPAWRLDMARALEAIGRPEPGRPELGWRESARPDGGDPHDEPACPAAWGDVILGRREIATSYHLAVVIDDAAQGVSHVVRGRDLFRATGLHRLLQVLLGLDAPVYHHHRLVLDAQGRKLSKSLQSQSLRAMREAGATPGDVLTMIGLGI